jgi:hypothetical protein
MDEYLLIHKNALENNFKRTISNLRFKLDSLILSPFYDKLKDTIINTASYHDFISHIDINNEMIYLIKEVKVSEISKNKILSTGIINYKNLKLIENKNKNDKIFVTIIDKGEYSEDIKKYINTCKNPYDKNNKKKNSKIKQSLVLWRNHYVNNKTLPTTRVTKDNGLTKESTTTNDIYIKTEVINNIQIKKDQVITSGRMGTPNTITFSFIDKSSISFRKNFIQIIPAKDQLIETFEMFENKISNLINFTFSLLEKENIHRNNLKYTVSYNIDLIYYPKCHLFFPLIKTSFDKTQIKMLVNAVLIRNVASLLVFNSVVTYIDNYINKYEKIYKSLKKMTLKNYLNFDKNSIDELIDNTIGLHGLGFDTHD